MTTPTYNETLMRQAERTIREAYKRSDLTPEQISLLEAKRFPFQGPYSCTDHTGRIFPSQKTMCEAWGIPIYTYQSRIKRGWSVEEALTGKSNYTAHGKPCTDHLGHEFPSKKEMCEHWGVTLTTFLGRRSRGMSLKEALEGREPTVFDHTGQGFATKVEMAGTWGITPTQLKMRLKRGWTLEEALTGNREGARINIKYCDHEGAEYPTCKAMCEAWGIDPNTYSARIANGWSVEEALTGNRDYKAGPKPCTDHTGQTFSSIAEMCSAWHVRYSAYTSRIAKGWTIEEALTRPVLKQKPEDKTAKPNAPQKKAASVRRSAHIDRTITDHTGQTFSSLTAMCEAWGISKSAYDYRIKRGWSIERSLTTPVEQTSCQDHTGREFPTKRAMCKAWGVKHDTYFLRVKKGWTVEEALTGKRSTTPERKGTACEDHEGNTYPSIKAMCRAWGVDYGVFNARIKDGWSVEEAITGTGGRDLTCTDHLGQTFPNKQVMCDHWGISRTTFGGRIAKGWSVEEALTGSRKCHDHLGNEFDTPAAMCRHYNLKRNTYENRLLRGWTIEEALTGNKAHVCGKPCTDHLGQEFPSKTAMYKHWGVEKSIFNRRLQKGWSLEEALTGIRKKGGNAK